MKLKVENDKFDLYKIVNKMQILTNEGLQLLFDLNNYDSEMLITNLLYNSAVEKYGKIYKIIDKDKFIQIVLNMGFTLSPNCYPIFDTLNN